MSASKVMAFRPRPSISLTRAGRPDQEEDFLGFAVRSFTTKSAPSFASLKAMDLPPRKDYTVQQLKDMGRSTAEIQELMDAGWVINE